MPAITDTPSTVGFATVIFENANIRAGPGINYAVTGYVKMGDQLFVYGQNENGKWFQLDRDGKMWIKASLVEKATQTPKSISGPSEAENTPIIETSPTSTPDYLIIDVTTLIGTPVAQVEQMLGQAILVTPNNDQSDTLAGGEFRDYMIGKYRACLSFDKNGIARGFQVLEGLIEDDYSLSDWREILPRFGINLPVEPDKTARVALYWYNYNGYGIIISANNMSGRPVWSVQIDEADIFQ